MKNHSNYCPAWRDILATTRLDELSPTERDAFDQHLISCSACKAVLEEIQEMNIWLRSAFLPEQPLPSWQEIKARYRKSRRSISPFPGKPFMIQEVGTICIDRENPDQFIEGWSLYEVIGPTKRRPFP